MDGLDDEGADRRVFELGEAYLDWLQLGGEPQRDAVLASHPQIAEALGKHLALIEILHGACYLGGKGRRR